MFKLIFQGPVFRDGPYSLSYNDPTALKKIHALGRDAFPKAEPAGFIGTNPEHPPVFFALTPTAHQKAKRKVAAAVSLVASSHVNLH